jgi:hypothetical protein
VQVPGARTLEEETNQLSFFGRAEPAEAHHVHHVLVAVTVELHRPRTVSDELEACLFSLGLLRGLLLCAGGQLLVSDLGEPLIKVERFRLGGLLGLRAQSGDFGADLLERGPF